MYSIAFCDDDIPFMNQASEEVGDRFALLRIPVEVWTYSSPAALLQAMKDRQTDAVFLDMVMPDMDGLETGRQIRDMVKSRMIPIIFLSSHDSLVYSALQVQPLRFIRKKYFREEIDEALQALLRLMKEADADTLAVRAEGGNVLLRIQEILYIESLAKKQLIHMLSGKIYDCRITLGELEEQLKGYSFVRPHKSYLVNCRYIHLINAADIQMQGGMTIPMSRHRKEEVKRVFIRKQTKDL